MFDTHHVAFPWGSSSIQSCLKGGRDEIAEVHLDQSIPLTRIYKAVRARRTPRSTPTLRTTTLTQVPSEPMSSEQEKNPAQRLDKTFAYD